MSDSASETYDPLDGKTPLTVIMESLADKAEGKPVDEDRLQYAVALASVATLMNQGLSMDLAIAATESAMDKGDIHVSYSEKDGLEIEFGEGIVAAGRKRADQKGVSE